MMAFLSGEVCSLASSQVKMKGFAARRDSKAASKPPNLKTTVENRPLHVLRIA
jgi:hypothetical protein